MKKSLFGVIVLILSALPAEVRGAGDAPRGFRVDHYAARGVPMVVSGRLGTLDPDAVREPVSKSGMSLPEAQARIEVLVREFFGATGSERLIPFRAVRDELGYLHVRFREEIRGIPVAAAHLVLHADAGGEIYMVNGEFISADEVPLHPKLAAEIAAAKGLTFSGLTKAERFAPPSLAYVLGEDGHPVLAWQAGYRWRDEEGLHVDRLFFDAATGELRARHPQLRHARNRHTYDAGHTINVLNLPGTLLMRESDSTHPDLVAQTAHANMAAVYEYFAVRHLRDSWNGSGIRMDSSVHFGNHYDNAVFCNVTGCPAPLGTAYGDGNMGNPIPTSPLSDGLDVVAHEFTHGFNYDENQLNGNNEPGAIDESIADIMGAAVEIFTFGSSYAGRWVFGDKVADANVPSVGIRYLNDPVNDANYVAQNLSRLASEFGSSRDYYPDRYTGSKDNGGVHFNSGISNLAFYLMVNGGRHPRGKTTNWVTKTGQVKSEKAYYRAARFYLTPLSDFSALRIYTAQAGGDLYGATVKSQILQAWDAVGVP